MIPNFRLDKINFIIDNGKCNGLLHLTNELNDDWSNSITLSGNVVKDNIIYDTNAEFKIAPSEKKVRVFGHDGENRIDLTLMPSMTKKPKDFKFQVVGQYGDMGIFKTFGMGIRSINITADLIFDTKSYPINLTLGSRMMSDKFVVSGVDNITDETFFIAITPKIGMKIKYQISGTYGDKILPSRTIDANTNVLKEIIKEIKDNIIQ